jgi:hypothetical protein
MAGYGYRCFSEGGKKSGLNRGCGSETESETGSRQERPRKKKKKLKFHVLKRWMFSFDLRTRSDF